MTTTSAYLDRDFCLQKIDSTIDLIKKLIDGDHPHADSREALKKILGVYARTRALLLSIDQYAQADSILGVCLQANQILVRYKAFLGFLLRSTHIRNAFEIYFPIRIIASSLVSSSARVVLGSEWNFSPYTYPLALKELPEFIFIGIPASECQNALILPLAGHELGHVVWQRTGPKAEFDQVIKKKIIGLYQQHYDQFSNLFDVQVPAEKIESDLFSLGIWTKSYELAQRQLEEIFCDFVGTYLFGRSFLYSFRYLLAPGLSATRSPLYPPIDKRARYLLHIAREFQITDTHDFAGAFKPQHIKLPAESSFMLQMADEATDALYSELIAKVEKYCAGARKFSDGSPLEPTVRSFLRALVPPAKIDSIATVINAAWDIRLDIDAWSIFDKEEDREKRRREKLRVLNELVLKSFEVYEYEKRRT